MSKSTSVHQSNISSSNQILDTDSHVEEIDKSRAILFILIVTALCLITVKLTKSFIKFIQIPQSIFTVGMGALIGSILRMSNNIISAEKEAFPPTIFFLVILPPIIFESGFNLNKQNFFANIGSISLFAVLGTIISTLVIGYGIFIAGKYETSFRLTIYESFAFAALISAIDPVATLTIFEALNIDHVLHMLVFGESILNDAVSIVLTTSVAKMNNKNVKLNNATNEIYAILEIFFEFAYSFLMSSLVGITFGLLSAVILKWITFRRTSMLELGIFYIFAYIPYCVAEALHLSGIMTILFTGITMSQYTFYNLSVLSRINVKEGFKTLAILSETCMFAYLGLAIFSFPHVINVKFVLVIFLLCLIGRALNIFPLALVLNLFRSHKIPFKHQFLMWFSGLRGAIAFALCLQLDWLKKNYTRKMLMTTTLIVTLTSILVLGGLTKPLISLIEYLDKRGQINTRDEYQKVLEGSFNVRTETDIDYREKEEETDWILPGEDDQGTKKEKSNDSEEVLNCFQRFEKRYLLPILIYRPSDEDLEFDRSRLEEHSGDYFKIQRRTL